MLVRIHAAFSVLVAILAIALPASVAGIAAPPVAWTDHDLVVSSTVEPLIAEMRYKFERNPLVQYLDLKSHQGQDPKPFLPYMTFFVNSFSDLNRMVLPFRGAPEEDKLKQAINEHCEEDSRHLYLLWKDLEHYSSSMANAGITSFSDSVQFLWSDDVYDVRKLGYEVARLSGAAQKPVQRYAMIRVMEELGNVFFTTGVGYVMCDGVPSQYMGHDHLDLENGHLQGFNSTASSSEEEEEGHDHAHGLEELFNDMDFENEQDRDVAVQVMRSTFELFDDMLTCVHRNMMSGNGFVAHATTKMTM